MAQERVVQGTMLDNEGYPIPGVNILIKGTDKGIVTDLEGKYSFKAPLGSILIFSSIGYSTREVKVTESNSLPLNYDFKAPKLPERKSFEIIISDTGYVEGKGIARLGDNAAPFVLKSGGEPNYMNNRNSSPRIPVAYSIKYINPFWAKIFHGSAGKDGVYFIRDKSVIRNYTINFNSSFTIDEINRLPKLQNQYAQGLSIDGVEQFLGPESGEPFSWGPKISSLEFDGSAYPYDNSGFLVPRGTGNGNPSIAYNPYDFFRKGLTFDNSIKVSQITPASQMQLAFSRRYQQGIIPNSDLFRNNFQLRYLKNEGRVFNYKFLIAYTDGGGRLIGRGANIANIMSSVYRTPPTFDNSNGIPNKSTRNAERYLLRDGRQRNSSPGQTDNPFRLIETMPDTEKFKNFNSNLNLKYDIDRFNFDYTLGVERQNNDVIYGLPLNAAGALWGRSTERSQSANTINSILQPAFQDYFYNGFIKLNAAYHLKIEENTLDRTDHFNTERQDLSVEKYRTTQELKAQGIYKYRRIFQINLSSGSYFSSTAETGKSFLPGGGASFNFSELFYSNILTSGEIHANFVESVREAALIYNNWDFNSTSLPTAHYQSYYESSELFHHKDLELENLTKFETGLSLGFFHNSIKLEVNYFNNLTKNSIVPVLEDEKFKLKNIADIVNKGVEGSIGYSTNGEFLWHTKLHFTLSRPFVKKLHTDQEKIALAGFSNISTSLVEGQPVGIIYGSRYLRNEFGQLIIGEEGFPLVDPLTGPIGNPNPDWIAGVSNDFTYKGFLFSFVVDIRKGGEIWNGTNNVLNYMGMSEETQEQRTIKNHIFEGVKEDGTPNDKAVDFANPGSGIENNRWVRYGFNGVDEEAIEDGSWIRLNEVKLSYSFPKDLIRHLKISDLNVSMFGRNLLLFTHYSGVDPASNMFGYRAGMGLDFFNSPGTRSYGMSLNIKI